MKIFFDQNLTFRLPEVIKAFYKWDFADLVCVHISEKFGIGLEEGIDDKVWLSQLSAEGGWIVFSTDRGKSSNIQPLPEICVKLNITHILLGQNLAKPSKIKQALVECWEQIRWLSEQKAGTRAHLKEETTKKGDVKYCLHVVDITKVIDRRNRRLKNKFVERKVPKVSKPPLKRIPKDANGGHPELFGNP